MVPVPDCLFGPPVLSAAALSSFLGGVTTHYLVFEITHWFAHVADNDFDRMIRRIPVLRWMREIQLRHHRLHHETPELDFNFVPPFAMDHLGATYLVPGDCTETSEGPCFRSGTMRLRTRFDRVNELPMDARAAAALASPSKSLDRPDSAEERSLP